MTREKSRHGARAHHWVGWAEPQTGACPWWRTRSGEWRCRNDPGSSARGGRAAANARRTARRIDYSDTPEASPEQLKAMRRVGRPPLGDEPRRLIAILVDPSVLESFRKEAAPTRPLPDADQRGARGTHPQRRRVGDLGAPARRREHRPFLRRQAGPIRRRGADAASVPRSAPGLLRRHEALRFLEEEDSPHTGGPRA